jgi:transposase, IS30 family
VFDRSVRGVFWARVAAGASTEDAGSAAGVSGRTAHAWFGDRGGVPPRHLADELRPRLLSATERAVIQIGLHRKLTFAAIARELDRPTSTVTREVHTWTKCNSRGYDARLAHLQAERRRPRPKPSKLSQDPLLRMLVQACLDQKWSPEQISSWLRERFPEQGRMRVSAETIYQSIFIQARGDLKRDVESRLRTGRTLRKPRARASVEAVKPDRFEGMVMIAERPAEIEDRAVPGHLEGDLIIGKDNGSQIGTLVERTSRAVKLVHLPGARDAITVADAILSTISDWPASLRKSITWDQGSELAAHQRITMAAGARVYFCDPHSPWQRGTNENTNGLLRQYFPKGTDLSGYTRADLDAVEIELNGRPRKSLGWRSPAEVLIELLSAPQTSSVANTP